MPILSLAELQTCLNLLEDIQRIGQICKMKGKGESQVTFPAKEIEKEPSLNHYEQ